ncbi:MAG: cory-CC-star protein [Bacillota bacterium]
MRLHEFKGKVEHALRLYEEFFQSKYRAQIAREARHEEDLFILLAFSDLLGIPNPVQFYTLELYPHLYERFHQWHKRMGMEKSPITGFS